MDQNRIPQSELLQSRLRDHKAESARDFRPSPQDPSTHAVTPGRDDDIFTEEELERLAGKTAARQFQSSPAAPSSWRYDRDRSRTRRTTTLGSSTSTSANNTPRAMGVREMEDHIDKLSKQNFDLKMEVFHRREKVEQLEKKLQDYPQLEEDLNSALDANDELVDALEARDRAVDEAVVMITELEQQNRDLEQQLAEARATAARSGSASPALPSSPGRRPQKSSRKSRERRSVQGAVSPDVSARMVQLAKSSDESQEPGPMPSFLKSREPTTAALRSMYVEGDQVVRPIPSYATLLSHVNSDGNEEYVDNAMDGMKSPRLSELSESDLRSIYNRGQSPNQDRDAEKVSPPQGQMSPQANARVSRWVADRAISPAKLNSSGKPTGQDADGFQSLDHVLTRQPAMPQTEMPAKPNSHRPRTQQQLPEKDGHTPPMLVNPVFGQNMFPPTPDTMMTRPSNNSTTSFIQDSNPFDASAGITRAPLASTSQSQPHVLVTPLPRKQSVTPNSLLPREFDAYGSPPRDNHRGGLDGTQDLGDPIYGRGYSSDGSYTVDPIRMQPRQRQASLAGSTAIDADSLQDGAPTRSSPSPPRFFDSKRPLETSYSALPSRSKAEVFIGYPETRQPPYGNQRTPAHSSFTPRNHVRGISSTSSVQTPRPSQPLPATTSSGIPLVSREAAALALGVSATSPPSAKSTTSLAARTASIRNRFSRRKTTSATIEDASTPTTLGRGNGIAQRLWFRRSSSEHSAMPMIHRDESEQFGSAAKPSPTTPFWSSERGVAISGGSIPSPPQRSKSERRRPSLSLTSRSNLSNTSFGSIPGRGKLMTPSEQSLVGDEASLSPSGKQRRPSLSGRLGSSGGRKGGSKSDIPPVPNTPTEYLKSDSEPEPARSRWRLGGRSRSSSRTRQEPVWPTTLTGFDGTAAGRRG